MSINIHTPGAPSHLLLTQGMVEDFLCDPVLAYRWIFQRELDVFQRVRLKMMWWVPELMDSSGISTGKTFTDFGYACLRAMLLPNLGAGQDVGVYFHNFQIGKDTFWTLFAKIRSPVFRANLGNVEDGDDAKQGQRKGPSSYTATFRSGGTISMPAPDIKNESANQASRRFNAIIFEEWTKFDAAGDAINSELIGRAAGTASFNANHPLWQNHLKFMGHAETRSHPSWVRYRSFLKRIREGDPRVAVISFNFKHWSGRLNHEGRSFRDAHRTDSILNSQIQADLAKGRTDQVLCKTGGFWVENARGLYPQASVDGMVAVGRRMGTAVQLGRQPGEDVAE